MKQVTSAGGIVYKPNDDDGLVWLLVHHIEGHWGFPKGHVGDSVPEEELEQAAVREVLEEGGVHARIVKKIPLTSNYDAQYDNELEQKTVWYFLMEYLEGDTSDHDDEVKEARFLTAHEALQLLSFERDREIFKYALSLIP